MAQPRKKRAVSARRGHGPQRARAPGRAALPMPALLLNADPVPDVVTIPARQVLAFDGSGGPEREGFQRALGAIYGIAYTLKFARKKAGPAGDFAIGPLEARWSADLTGESFVEAPRERWRWQLRMAVPADVTAAEVAAAIATATGRKGGKLEHSAEATAVRLERLPAQQVGRALHVGPYATERETLDRIHAALAEAALTPAFTHVEIYLRDPRRTAPAKLETVLLRELA